MSVRTRTAFWFVAGLVLVAVASTGLQVVVAQSRSETRATALDTSEATFELLGENLLVNTTMITYTSEEDGWLDIFFACSSTRGTDPLRLKDPNDIARAKSYFSDEKRSGKQFLRFKKYCINVRNIVFIEYKDDEVIVNFNSRIMDAFAQLILSGADAECFRKKRREF